MSENFEMNGLTWVNKTNYAKGENSQNKKSDVFATKINDQGSIIIIYGHRDYPTRWIFSFAPLDFYQMPLHLKAQTKEEAAQEAIEICLKTIEELKKGFEVK